MFVMFDGEKFLKQFQSLFGSDAIFHRTSITTEAAFILFRTITCAWSECVCVYGENKQKTQTKFCYDVNFASSKVKIVFEKTKTKN